MLIGTQPRATPLTRLDLPDLGDTAAGRRPLWPAAAGIVCLAAALRFGGLGSGSVWFDEAVVAKLAQQRWAEILTVLATRDVHPPLYFFLMKAWIGLAGTGAAALRFPSALASVTSVLLAYLLLRQVAAEGTSLLGALLLSLSPFDVMAAQEARMYALLEVLVLASTLALIHGVRRGGVRWWAGYAAAAAAMIYTHNLGLCVLAAHGLWVAGFERRHVRAWLTSAAAAVALYAPWIPSLWHQFAVIELHRAWFRHAVGSADLTGVVGLLAFGGSLFGMPSFFDNGALHPAAQWLILLPFFALVWRGAAAKSIPPADRALLAGCLAVPIATMFLISLIKPAFYPRWFSFLAPFFAMLTALGAVETAKGFPLRRALLPALAAGVLLCGVPVLVRYYFDPSFRPYQWRAAAALVRAQAQPDDFLLYVHSASEIAFEYYFHEPHPSLTLNPIEAVGGANARPGFTAAQAHTLAARYRRVWVIIVSPFDERMQQRLLPALDSAFRFGEWHDFGNVFVVRLESKR